MSYLTPGDYKKSIQSDNLQQIIAGDGFILEDAMSTAIEMAQSLLVQKYDIAREFKKTAKWIKADAYTAFDRVYLDPPQFSAASPYSTGDYVYYTATASTESKVYKATTAIVAGAFNPGQWTEVGYRYALYSGHLPASEFDYRTIYKAGNQVFYKNKVYTCLVASSQVSHQQAIQYITYESVPYGNVFPDDPQNGATYWGAGVTYSIPGNSDITDATRWNAGDNRSKTVVWCIVAMTLYLVHSRIAPRNIPELRFEDWKEANKKLKDFAKGIDSTAINLVPLQPKQGGRIRYGGNVKNSNTY